MIVPISFVCASFPLATLKPCSETRHLQGCSALCVRFMCFAFRLRGVVVVGFRWVREVWVVASFPSAEVKPCSEAPAGVQRGDLFVVCLFC